LFVTDVIITHISLQDLPEQNNNVLLQGPEFPFGVASSVSEPNNNFEWQFLQDWLYAEPLPWPDFHQEDLDMWLNGIDSNVDNGSPEKM
jgi:hypothetical protein